LLPREIGRNGEYVVNVSTNCSECGVIIPVLKVSNDNMQIGTVKFYEQ